MKITAIYGAIPSSDYGLLKVFEIIKSTMSEIGEEINIINLLETNLPYYNGGAPVPALTAIVNTIAESDGIILLSPSNLFAPTGIMQTFLEYLAMPIYKNTLKGKNCMTVSISHNQGISSTMNYFSTVINYLGGYNSVNIPLATLHTKNIDEPTKILLEKYTEDFYRYVKQGRKFFTSSEFSSNSKSTGQVAPAGGVFSKPAPKSEYVTPPVQNEHTMKKPVQQMQPTTPSPTFKKSNVANAYNSNVMDNFLQAQEDDISQITNLLSSKLNKTKPVDNYSDIKTQNINFNNQNYAEQDFQTYTEPSPVVIPEPVVAPTPIETKNSIFNNFDLEQPIATPRQLNCKQMTQNLTHYYQPHLADGLKATIALNISGNEAFNGYIDIEGNTCIYADGAPSSPDVTILATDDIWKQIIKGNVTTQRAFMTGQLKVRGNFVLLSKFDIIFKR